MFSVMMAFEFLNLYSGTELPTTIYTTDAETHKCMEDTLRMGIEKAKGTSAAEKDAASEPKSESAYAFRISM